MGKIDAGETVQMQAQMELQNVADMKGSPDFSLLVQCECLSTQLSDIELSAQMGNNAQEDTVTSVCARRFRIFYKEQTGETEVQRFAGK